MKDNFHIMVKKINVSPGSTESPKKDGCKEDIPKHIIKMPKVKYKERILKTSREKHIVTYRGVPIRLSAGFSKETLQAVSIH